MIHWIKPKNITFFGFVLENVSNILEFSETLSLFSKVPENSRIINQVPCKSGWCLDLVECERVHSNQQVEKNDVCAENENHKQQLKTKEKIHKIQ